MSKQDRRRFLQSAALAAVAIAGSSAKLNAIPSPKHLRFRLLRHASLLVEAGDQLLLVDPFLSEKDALDPIPNASNNLRIPMVELPVNQQELSEILARVDAIIVTHTHRDHWDIAARQMIAKDKLIICQPADEMKIKEQGFTNLQPVSDSWQWKDLTIYRTNGQHGTGETGKRMGTVSGFVIEYKQTTLYIAGDTIWCKDVADAIQHHRPSHIVVNGGGARFLEGDPITMTTDDVSKLAAFTRSKITVVHLETVNHCLQKRADFRAMVRQEQLDRQVFVPNDGEWTTI